MKRDGRSGSSTPPTHPVAALLAILAVEAGQDFGSAAWLERHYESRQRRVNDAAVGAMDSLRALFATQVAGSVRAGGSGG